MFFASFTEKHEKIKGFPMFFGSGSMGSPGETLRSSEEFLEDLKSSGETLGSSGETLGSSEKLWRALVRLQLSLGSYFLIES